MSGPLKLSSKHAALCFFFFFKKKNHVCIHAFTGVKHWMSFKLFLCIQNLDLFGKRPPTYKLLHLSFSPSSMFFFFFAFRYNWRAKTLPFTWILWEHCEVNNPLSILMCLGSRKSQGNGKRRWVASQREDTLGSLTCHLQPVRTYTTFIKVSL